jgi:hypothetical protein
MYIVKINDPRGGVNFDPWTIIWTILIEVHYTMYHAKYLTSSLCQFLDDDFLKILLYTYKENPWSWGGANFDARGKI